MVSFRDKLARLAPEQGGEDAKRLAHLRAQLGELQGAGSGCEHGGEPAEPELPFVSSEGPAGIVHRRASLEPLDREVGRQRLCDAIDADPTILALLSLTPALASCSSGRALYLDAETTGLGGGTGNKPFLVGMSWLDEASGRWHLEQLLLHLFPVQQVVPLQHYCSRQFVQHPPYLFPAIHDIAQETVDANKYVLHPCSCPASGDVSLNPLHRKYSKLKS